jgi:hypothetical protein
VKRKNESSFSLILTNQLGGNNMFTKMREKMSRSPLMKGDVRNWIGDRISDTKHTGSPLSNNRNHSMPWAPNKGVGEKRKDETTGKRMASATTSFLKK